MNELLGYIERITFQNPENGYTVAQLKEKNCKDLHCIVGCMPGLQPGETVRCQGQWKNHLVYGRQFIVESHFTETPADVIGIKKYLSSGLIKGIGVKYAARITEKFDTETLTIIDRYPERLHEIEGLGKKRIDSIVACWSEQKSIRGVMIFLQSHGVSPAYAQKVFKTYGDQSIKKVQENPFHLAKDIRGVGFKTADTIAQKLGIPKDAPGRIDAGIEHTLSEQSDEGHVCFPVEEFMKLAIETLDVPKEIIEARLPVLVQEKRIEIAEMGFERAFMPFIWLRPLFLSEVGICRQIARLRQAHCHLRPVDIPRALEWVQAKLSINFAANQQEAIAQSIKEKIQIITGGPGTGKSTITKAILAITQKLTDKIILAAPTGRAAKRMTEITGVKAKTIHNLLEYDFKNGKFKRNLENTLDCDLIIIDESSMIDTYLMYSLLKAIANHTRVIFIGDINQLPSVGPGNVLKDMIASRVIPITALNEIFRQAAGSKIITNAHRINQGTFPDINNQNGSDFFFIDVETPEQILTNILALVTQRIPSKYGLNPFQDIQVLAPMRRGIIGIDNLNTVLQEQLNPRGTPLLWAGRRFLQGDKVMQIRNNYKREVFNGDIGLIASINTTEQEMIVRMDDREIIYAFSDLDELVLAYSVSVHKYQGSESPCVVIPVHTTHFKLLHRNLLYTAVTRGKKLVILVGTKKAIALAVKNDEVKRRYTGLKQGLTGAFSINISQPI